VECLRLPLTVELDAALQALSLQPPFQGKAIEEIAVSVILDAHLQGSVAAA
jgi:hypothetical protein